MSSITSRRTRSAPLPDGLFGTCIETRVAALVAAQAAPGLIPVDRTPLFATLFASPHAPLHVIDPILIAGGLNRNPENWICRWGIAPIRAVWRATVPICPSRQPSEYPDQVLADGAELSGWGDGQGNGAFLFGRGNGSAGDPG